MKDKGYAGIDYFRIAAAVMVIAIHTYPLASYHENAEFLFTHVFCRLAVPFFFLTSGFFLFRNGVRDGAVLGRYLKKILFLYGISVVLYLPVNVYMGYFKQPHLLPHLLRDLFWNGTLYHLWYFPVAALGACVAWLCIRYLRPRTALLVTAALYLLGLFGDSYYGFAEKLTPAKAFYSALFEIFDYTRNGLFFAPFFFVLGGVLLQGRKPLVRKISVPLFCISLLFLLGEGSLLKRAGVQRHDSMYLFLAPCAVFLFSVLLSVSARKNRRRKRCALVSVVVYIIHPYVILLLRMVAKLISQESLLIRNSGIHFTLVTLISIAAACFLVHAVEFLKPSSAIPVSRVTAEIHTDHLRSNLQTIQALLPEKGRVMAVVKADAYGHGAALIASVLQEEGVSDFAVATLEEGIALRQSGIRGQILILGYTDPGEALKLRKYRLTQTLISREHAAAFHQKGVRIDVHIKIDTGMHRLGLDPENVNAVEKIFRMKTLHVTGIYTHLCAADSLTEENVSFTLEQVSKMETLLAELRSRGISLPAVHVQSSSGLLNYPYLQYAYVRVGIALYGVKSSEETDAMAAASLKPVLELKSQVILLRKMKAGESVGYGRKFSAKRDSVIAVVSAGYADGIPRSLSGKGSVLIRGMRAPIVGNICMDQLTVDVTDIAGVSPGDTVTFIGTDGALSIRAETVAAECDSITNELLCRIGDRTKRVMV